MTCLFLGITDAGDTVGRPTHPRRAAEARHQCIAGHRGEVPRASPWSPVSVVALLPHQSCLPARLDRLFHGSQRHGPRIVCVGGAGSRLTPHRPRQRHGASDRGVDRATTPRGMAVGHRPRFVIRDRDAIYGSDPRRTVQQTGIEEVLTAPRCPWQNPFLERVICSLRRVCLDHVLVWDERSLHRYLYLACYHEWRTHLLAGQGYSRPAGCPAASLRHDRLSLTRRRLALSLRTSRRLNVGLSAASRDRTHP